MKMRVIVQILLLIFPWCIRRRLLTFLFGFDIHPTSHIGFSIILARSLTMHKGANISHFNIIIYLDKLELGEKSFIGRGNWITGFPTGTASKHFAYDIKRKCELIIGRESAITKNHHIDCTNTIYVGNFVTIAGYNSQLLTHSIDVYKCRQDSHPIVIGDYSFVSTGVKILGGAVLPAHSVLAAGAVLNKQYNEEWMLYAGVPAKGIKKIPQSALYFTRESGYVS